MRRQLDGPGTSPDSWQGTEQDPWWAEQRRIREQKRRERLAGA